MMEFVSKNIEIIVQVCKIMYMLVGTMIIGTAIYIIKEDFNNLTKEA